MYDIKTEDIYDDFYKDKKSLDFNNYPAKSKHDESNKLVVGKMKHETNDVVIKEFIRLNLNMYSFMLNDSSEHKKAKDMNKNVVAGITHSECKDFFNDQF